MKRGHTLIGRQAISPALMVVPGSAIKRYKHQTDDRKISASMSPKPNSTRPRLSANELGAAHFGQVSPDLWKIDGKTITIDEYIENRRRDVKAMQICVLQAFTNRLLDKLNEVDRSAYPELRGMVQLLVRILKSTAVNDSEDPLPDWLAEVGFATTYLLERYDLIPDHVQDIGLADDVLILKRVIARNELNLILVLNEDGAAF